MSCPICTGQGSACYCEAERRISIPTWQDIERDKARRLAEDKRIAEQTIAMLDAEKRILADRRPLSPRNYFIRKAK